MTQKELLYVEDAIGHEKNMIAYLQEMKNRVEEKDCVHFVDKELKMHQQIENDLGKLLEVKGNE